MKLWKISQYENRGWDTYDSIIVAAETEYAARMMPPGYPGARYGDQYLRVTWVDDPSQVTVVLIGEAVPGTVEGVVLASFNAG